MEKEDKRKHEINGYGFRLAQAVIFYLAAILFFAMAILMLFAGIDVANTLFGFISGALILIFAVLFTIFAKLGKKQIWANVVFIVFFTLILVVSIAIGFVDMFVSMQDSGNLEPALLPLIRAAIGVPISFCGIIGGILGYQYNTKNFAVNIDGTKVTLKRGKPAPDDLVLKEASGLNYAQKVADGILSATQEMTHVLTSGDGRSVDMNCVGYTLFRKSGKNRLYIYFTPVAEPENLCYFRVVADRSGECALVEERDGDVRAALLLRYKEMSKIAAADESSQDDDFADKNTEENASYNNAVASGQVTERKRGKAGIIILCAMAAYYIFLLVFGILCMSMPERGFAWGPYEDFVYTYAMNITTGFILILLVPSFGYYFAFRAPINMPSKVRALIVVACGALTLAGDVAYYITMGDYLELLSFTMKIAPVLAEVGLFGVFGIGLINVPSDKLVSKKYEKTGDNFKDVLGELLTGLGNLLKWLVVRRRSYGFIIGGVLLFTLCIFVLMELLYVLIAIIAILAVIVLLGSLYTKTERRSYKIIEFGQERTLVYDSYNGFTGEDVYKDDIGNRWATNDGGSTFHRYD